jgi:hypothetical protein
MSNCECIACLGAPWSPVECSDQTITAAARTAITARNAEWVADSPRNYENTAMLTDYSA